MLTKIEALNYRALRYISQPLEPFQILIGPNASGKTTFLDVIALLADIIPAPNLSDAIRQRVPDFRDLTWQREGDWFELAVEARVPDEIKTRYRYVRYEVRLGVYSVSGEIAWLKERLLGYFESNTTSQEHKNYKTPTSITDSSIELAHGHVIATKSGNAVHFIREMFSVDSAFTTAFDGANAAVLGSLQRSILNTIPPSEDTFPAIIWFKRFITEQVTQIMLNSEALRRPTPPQSPRRFLPDGSNLPRIIDELTKQNPTLLEDWIRHIRTALPDIRSISTIERPEDRHRYLVIEYDSGVKVPSWSVSDGTLRLLALTILAYLPDARGIYLIEEPENGIHPRAVETVMQSLSSVYDAQVLLATHSPIILSLSKPEQLLVFSRTEQGETQIVRGDEHALLSKWRGEVDLSTLFAAGVLG